MWETEDDANSDGDDGNDDDEGEEDEYPLEDVEVGTSDLVVPANVASFRKAWETLGDENEIVEKYGSGHDNVASFNTGDGMLNKNMCESAL